MISIFSNISISSTVVLWALASLIVPVLIHLFNINRGKLVLIGNLNFVTKSKLLRLTELKVRQWLLLVLRLIIFILLFFIMADLLIQKPLNNNEKQLLLTPNWLDEASDQQLMALRALNNDRVILLNSDLIEKDIDSLSEIPKQQLGPMIKIEALLSELKNTSRLSNNLSIYTTNRLNFFSEKRRNIINTDIDWHIVDRSKVINQEINIKVFYSASRSLDQQYLKLALDFIAQSPQITLHVSYLPIKNVDFQHLNESVIWGNDIDNRWVFWLSEEPVDDEVLQMNKNGVPLIADAIGQDEESSSHSFRNIVANIEGFPITFFPQNKLDYQSKESPIWQSHQSVFLSRKANEQGELYQFNSRFNHDWNNLVKSVNFPIILSRLLGRSTSILEHKIISSSQIDSLASANNRKISVKQEKTYQSYRSIILLLLCLFWLVERILAEKYNRKEQLK